MPNAPARPCRRHGCGQLSRDGSGYCSNHLQDAKLEAEARKKYVQKEYDKSRGSSTERGYNARWRKARETYLRANPLCARCADAGRVTPATVVDHKIPHKGDSALFWDSGNWQALCRSCHNKKTYHEDGGKIFW